MDHINGFFSKFKLIFSSAANQRETASSVIEEVLKINLKPEQLQIRNGAIIVNGSPALKSQIFLHKENILKKLNVLKLKINDIH